MLGSAKKAPIYNLAQQSDTLDDNSDATPPVVNHWDMSAMHKPTDIEEYKDVPTHSMMHSFTGPDEAELHDYSSEDDSDDSNMYQAVANEMTAIKAEVADIIHQRDAYKKDLRKIYNDRLIANCQ